MYIKLSVILLIFTLCTACVPANEKAGSAEPAATDDAMVTEPQIPAVGDEIFVKDYNDKMESTGYVQDIFLAASGRHCTYYTPTNDNKKSSQDGLEFACLVDNKWEQIPMIINPENPATP